MGRLRLLFVCRGKYSGFQRTLKSFPIICQMKSPSISYIFCNFAGNTCRSPMAECIMRHLVKEYDLPWTCDSAGLRSWNVGRRPDERCLKVLDENGMTTTHYGRMVC